jgi:hypothetical protein
LTAMTSASSYPVSLHLAGKFLSGLLLRVRAR